jgi:hypothetical protein
MENGALDRRRGDFKWNSKQELCDYFNIRYGLSKKLIDSEIASTMKSFKLRKGVAIKTSELWQKVGLYLEKKIEEIEI